MPLVSLDDFYPELQLQRVSTMLPTTFPLVRERVAEGALPDLVSPEWLDMRWWASKVHRASRARQETMVSGRDIIRLQCQKSPLIGTWLDVIPSAALGLEISPPIFRLVVRWWLGLPLLSSPSFFFCLACVYFLHLVFLFCFCFCTYWFFLSALFRTRERGIQNFKR